MCVCVPLSFLFSESSFVRSREPSNVAMEKPLRVVDTRRRDVRVEAVVGTTAGSRISGKGTRVELHDVRLDGCRI